MTVVLPALLALVGAAPAEKPAVEKLAVIDIDSPDLMIGLGAQVTRAILDGAAKQKLAVLSPEELRGKLVPKQYDDLKRCAGAAACAAQFLDGMGASRAVLGSLRRDEKHYLLRLWLIDLKGVKVIADVDRPILIAARRFLKDVEQAVPPLLRGEQEARGILAVSSNVANAQVFVNGEAVGVAPVTLNLKPGKHEVRVERNKYLPITRLVNVEPNQKTEETLKLLLKPGEIADEQVVPGLVAMKKDGPVAPQPIHLSPQTWVAGSVAVAAAATGLGFGLSARSGEKDLVAGYNPELGVYAGTRKAALGVQRDALVANIAYGVAAAATIATAIFVVLDVLPSAPVTVAPAAGPGGAGVVVGGRF